MDSRGIFVAGKRSELELDFKDKPFEQFAQTGFIAALTIQAPAGSYSVRAVAQDGVEGKLAAASGNVPIKYAGSRAKKGTRKPLNSVS